MTYRLCHPDYQNYLYLHYYNNDGQSVDTTNPIYFKTEEFNTHPNSFDTTIFTAPFEGYYFFTGSVFTGNSVAETIIRLNNTTDTRLTVVYNKASRSFTYQSFLKKDDFVQFFFSASQTLVSAANRHFIKIYGMGR